MSEKTLCFTPTWIPFDLSSRLYHSLKLLHLIPYGWDDPSGLNNPQPIKVKEIPGRYVITFILKDNYLIELEINVSRLVDLGVKMPKEVQVCISLIKEALDYHDMIRNKLKCEKEAKQ